MKLPEMKNTLYKMKHRQMELIADYTLQKKISINQKAEQQKLHKLKDKENRLKDSKHKISEM